jgi:hypothetical protein
MSYQDPPSSLILSDEEQEKERKRREDLEKTFKALYDSLPRAEIPALKRGHDLLRNSTEDH